MTENNTTWENLKSVASSEELKEFEAIEQKNKPKKLQKHYLNKLESLNNVIDSARKIPLPKRIVVEAAQPAKPRSIFKYNKGLGNLTYLAPKY